MSGFGAGNVRKAPAKQETKPEPKVLPVTGDIEPAKPLAGTTSPQTIDGDALAAIARGFGAKASDYMETTATTIAKAREDWQGGPIMALFSFRTNYTEEEIASWPDPANEDKGNNPFKFTITYQDGDTKRTKKTNFIREFVHGSPVGVELLERLEWLDRAADKGAIKEGILEEILDYTPEKRHSERTFCESRLKTVEQAYIKALRLHFKMVEVQEYHEDIIVSPVWADECSPDEVEPQDVKLDRTNEPLCVLLNSDNPTQIKREYFSIGAFLKLMPAKALEKGGGWRNLIESGATKKGKKQNKKVDDTDLTIKTPSRFLGVLAEAHRYMAEISSATDGAEYAKVVQDLTGKDMDESIVALVELKNYFSDLCRTTKADQRYLKLKEAGSELVAA